LKTRHYPIEDTATETTWNYNADDSVSQVVDPRGAVTDMTYDSRGLTTQVGYTPGELVSIETDPTGERRKVKVYAGGSVVGEQSQTTLTGQSPTQGFTFFHADPVTGETVNKVYDALGQALRRH